LDFLSYEIIRTKLQAACQKRQRVYPFILQQLQGGIGRNAKADQAFGMPLPGIFPLVLWFLPRNGSWASRPVATRVNCEAVEDGYRRGLKPAFGRRDVPAFDCRFRFKDEKRRGRGVLPLRRQY